MRMDTRALNNEGHCLIRDSTEKPAQSVYIQFKFSPTELNRLVMSN